MRHLWIEIEVLDFDLETIGFDFNVLNPETTEPKSNSYLRMSLVELGVFIDALKASAANINLAAPTSVAGKTKTDRSPASNEQLLAGADAMKQPIAVELAMIKTEQISVAGAVYGAPHLPPPATGLVARFQMYFRDSGRRR